MKPTESIRERLLGPLDTERYVAVEEIAFLPSEQRIPLLKEGLGHWDRVLRERCAESLAKSIGPKAVKDILASELSVVFKIALMKYCEGAVAIDYIAKHLGDREEWSTIGDSVFDGYRDTNSILRIWRLQGIMFKGLEPALDTVADKEIAKFLAGVSMDTRYALLTPEVTREYLKRRGFIEVCRQFEEQSFEIARAEKERAEAKKIIDAETERKRAEASRKQAEIDAVRLGEHEAFLEKLQVDALFLGVFINEWKTLDTRYKKAKVKKKSGGFRQIAAPDDALKALQRKILERILNDAPLHSGCHGFRSGRSVRSNAQPHLNSELLINIDLKDFFPSITANRVYGVFKQLGYGDFQSSLLTRLTTYKGALPQGAPTSPAIANLAASRMDSRLHGLAEKIGAAYTRYADDMTFSGPATILSALPMVRRVISEESFQIAEHKFHIARPSTRQEVTGLTVNESLAIPRPVRKRIRAMLHHVTNGTKASWKGRKVDASVLQGVAAYVLPLHPELGQQCLILSKKAARATKKPK